MNWKHLLVIAIGAALPAADHVIEAAPLLTPTVLIQSLVAALVAAVAVYLKPPTAGQS